jgi:hypothetical protein
MSTYDQLRYAAPIPDTPASPHVPAPGKRTLTQSLAPVQRLLRDEQRAVVDFDDAAGDDVYDERATVEARPTEVPLTDRQLRRARRSNPEWIRKLKVSALIFGNAEVDSSAFALDVAAKQVEHGLAVDGIAGPLTVDAVARQVSDARSDRSDDKSRRDASAPRAVVDFDADVGDGFYDTRATVEPHDDPFGLHLLAGDRA